MNYLAHRNSMCLEKRFANAFVAASRRTKRRQQIWILCAPQRKQRWFFSALGWNYCNQNNVLWVFVRLIRRKIFPPFLPKVHFTYRLLFRYNLPQVAVWWFTEHITTEIHAQCKVIHTGNILISSVMKRMVKYWIRYWLRRILGLWYLFIYLKAKGHMATNMLKNNQLQLKSDQTLHQSLLKNTNRRRLCNVII